MKTFSHLLILLASLLLVTRLNAQTNQNIKLPSGYSSMTADITTGNDMIFAYASNRINVLNVADNSFIQKIPFDGSGIPYGKFNPVTIEIYNINQGTFNNNISSYIAPYQNRIYLPNDGHSNVSVSEGISNIEYRF